MAISSMFSSQTSPIAIDFGSATVKLLQIAPGNPPAVLSAAQIDLPDEVRADQGRRIEFLGDHLPRAIRKGRFKGKRATCSIPSARTMVQHFQVPMSSGVSSDDYIQTQLQIQTGSHPGGLVVRTVEVSDVYCDGSLHKETICFAVPREVVMCHIDLLRRCKLEVTGVHTEQHAMVWAFHHIHRRRSDDELTNLYVDFGWGGTKVGISHGRQLVFAKSIEIGGRHFDQVVADALSCDMPSARAHRIATAELKGVEVSKEAAPTARTGSVITDTTVTQAQAAEAKTAVAEMSERRHGARPASLRSPESIKKTPIVPEGVDCQELVDCIVDELAMCRQYHGTMFEGRVIDRVIFTGGEARVVELCRAVAQALALPAHLGDPMARMHTGDATMIGVKLGMIQPGWAIVCGLCSGAGSEKRD